MFEWFVANWAMIIAVMLGVSEALALIPALKANGILQMIISILKKLSPKKEEEEKKPE